MGWFGGVGDGVEARGRGFVRTYSPQQIQPIAVSLAQTEVCAYVTLDNNITHEERRM